MGNKSLALALMLACIAASVARAQISISKRIETNPIWNDPARSGVDLPASVTPGEPLAGLPSTTSFGALVSAQYNSVSVQVQTPSAFNAPSRSTQNRIQTTQYLDYYTPLAQTNVANAVDADAANTGSFYESIVGDNALLATQKQAASSAATDNGTDPVDPGSGAFVESWIDMHVPGAVGPAFTLERTYSSRSAFRGALGVGWGLSYHEMITTDESCDSEEAYLWYDSKGSLIRFTERDGIFSSADDASVLQFLGGGRKSIETGGELRTFNDGLLESIADRNGNTVNVHWVRSPYGRFATPLRPGLWTVGWVETAFDRRFIFSWGTNTSQNWLTITNYHNIEASATYTISNASSTPGAPDKNPSLGWNYDLVAVDDMWGKHHDLTWSPLVTGSYDDHIPFPTLEQRCLEHCGIDDDRGCSGDPCLEIARHEVRLCRGTCGVGCQNECGGPCKEDCEPDCAGGCSSVDCLRSCSSEEIRDACIDGLEEKCDSQCTVVSNSACKPCWGDNTYYGFGIEGNTNGSNIGGTGSTAIGGMNFFQSAACAVSCSQCVLFGNLCPQNVRCQDFGQGCKEDCIAVSMYGFDSLNRSCNDDDDTNTNGCFGVTTTACRNQCTAGAATCETSCVNRCEDRCDADCGSDCERGCRDACPTVDDMYDVCQDSCFDSCVISGSVNGTTQPPVTWGARQDLSHNLISLSVGGVLYLENTYGTDRTLPTFDRIIGQKHGPAKMQMSYTDVFSTTPDVEVCPKSPMFCETSSLTPERWIEGLDDLVFVVDLTVPMVPQWNIQATAGELPVFALKKVGTGLQMTPAASTAPILLSSSTGETIRYLPTVVPGYFAPELTGPTGASVPADLVIVKTLDGFAVHGGRLRGVLEVVSGALSYPVLDFKPDQNGRLTVTPTTQAFGDVEVRELARRSNGDGSGVARSSAVVRLQMKDGLVALSDREIVDGAADWAANNRTLLDVYDSPLVTGTQTVASIQTAVLQKRTADFAKLTDLDSSIAALLASSTFSADLTAQTTRPPSAAPQIATATQTAYSNAKQLAATASTTLKPKIEALPRLIESLQLKRTKNEYTSRINECITGIDAVMSSATTTERTKLTSIKTALTSASTSTAVLNALAKNLASLQADDRVATSIQSIRTKNAAALASLSGWAPEAARAAASTALLDFAPQAPADAHLWARTALQKLKTAWQGVRTKLPTGTPDLRPALWSGTVSPLTPVSPGIWIDSLLGAENLIVRGPRCTGGEYLAETRTGYGAQMPVLYAIFTDGENNKWSYFSDKNGLIVRTISPIGDVVNTNYDSQGRVVGQMGPFGDRMCYSYDGDGNISHTVHFPAVNKPAPQPSRRTSFVWSGAGLLSKVYPPDPVTGAVMQQPAIELFRDERGNATSVSMGSTSWDFEYDQYGRTLSAAAEDGTMTTFEYGTDKRFIHTTAVTFGASGAITEHEQKADDVGNVIQVLQTGAPERAITYQKNLPILIEDFHEDGTQKQSIAYAATGMVSSISDAYGAGKTEYRDYDARGLLVSSKIETPSASAITCYGYDGVHRLRHIVLPSGRMVGLERDADGNVVGQSRGVWKRDADNCAIYNGKSAKETSFTRKVIAGKPSEEWSEGATTKTAYSAYGEPIVVSDGLAFTHARFDARGRIIESVVRTSMSATPLATVSLTDSTVVSAQRFAYDTRDRVVSVGRAWFDDVTTQRTVRGWLTTSVEYDDTLGAKYITHPDNSLEQVWLDPVVGAYASIDAAGGLTTRDVSQDLRVELVKQPAPDGDGVVEIETTFNDRHQPVSSYQDGRLIAEHDYLANGQIHRIKNVAGVREYAYDDLGRAVSERRIATTGASQIAWQAGYDADGRQTVLYDADGEKAKIVYDAVGRRETITYADASFEEYKYTPGTSSVAELRTRNATTLTYVNEDGRLREIRQGTAVKRGYKWSAAGVVSAWITDTHGTIDTGITYDSLGRIVQESSSLFATPVTTTFRADGGLATLKAGGHLLKRQSDGVGRDADVSVDGTLLASYDRVVPTAAPAVVRANGFVEQPLFNGLSAVGFDDVLAGSVIRSVHAALADDGQVVRLDEKNNSTVKTSLFGLNGYNELVGEAHGLTAQPATATFENAVLPATTMQRTTDPRGNWTSLQRGTDGLAITNERTDRLSRFGDFVTGDAFGRVTSLPRVNKDRLDFTYDAFDEVVSITANAGKYAPRVDAFGRLVEIRQNGQRLQAFQYNKDKVLVQDRGGKLRFVVPGQGAVPLAIVDTVSGSNVVLFVHAGWNDRAAALSDAAGAIVARYETSAYGEVTALSPTGTAWKDPFAFNLVLGGQPSLPETGLQRFGLRWYGAEWGRFLTPDPIGFGEGINMYAFVGNQPLMFTDPSGLFCGKFDLLKDLGLALYGAGGGTVDLLLESAMAMKDRPVDPTMAMIKGTMEVLVGAAGLAVEINNVGAEQFYYNVKSQVGAKINATIRSPEEMGRLVPHLVLFVVGGELATAAKAGRGLAGTGAYLEGATGGAGLGKLAGLEIRVSQKGIGIVERHLAQFGDVPENMAMIARLRTALTSGARISGGDASFYMHELSEATMMGRGLSYEVAHSSALAKYGVSPFSVYAREVVLMFPDAFNSNFVRFWGVIE